MLRFISMLMLCVMVLTSIPCFAGVEVDTSGLTDEQKADLVKSAENMRSTATKITPDKVQEWVDLGKNSGMALASFAKEVGVAGDKFLESTTGKVVLAMIAFKMVGKVLIHFTAGILIFMIFIPILLWAYKKNYKKDKEGIMRETPSDGDKVVLYLGLIIILAISLIVIFTF